MRGGAVAHTVQGMNAERRPSDRIAREVTSWSGVAARFHRFGGIEFRQGKRELGHVHGDEQADLPFPRRIRDELIAAHRAEAHHVLPGSGWVTRRIHGDDDVADVIELFRLNYERRPASA